MKNYNYAGSCPPDYVDHSILLAICCTKEHYHHTSKLSSDLVWRQLQYVTSVIPTQQPNSNALLERRNAARFIFSNYQKETYKTFSLYTVYIISFNKDQCSTKSTGNQHWLWTELYSLLLQQLSWHVTSTGCFSLTPSSILLCPSFSIPVWLSP